MRYLLTSTYLVLLLLILSSIKIYAQRIPSTCIAPDSIVSKYRNDADQLAARRIYRQELKYRDSIRLPTKLSDTILNAMLAIYNLKAVKERDSIFSKYDIRTRKTAGIERFYMKVDSTALWVINLKKKIRPVGEPQIDELFETYNMILSSYYTMLFSDEALLSFKKLDTSYNLLPLVKRFNPLKEIRTACVETNVGDGDDIWDSIHHDHVELIFSIGRGDCPAGCTYRKNWRFKVYYDCSVEFIESYEGVNPDWVQKQRSHYHYPCMDRENTIVEEVTSETINLFPNPATTQISLATEITGEFRIYSTLGQVQKRADLKQGGGITNIDLTELPQGTYLLQIGDSYFTKFIKD